MTAYINNYDKKIRLVAIVAAILIYSIPFATMIVGGRGLLLWLGIVFMVLTAYQKFSNTDSLSTDGLGLLLLFFIHVFASSLWSPSSNMFEVFKSYMVTFLLCVNRYGKREQILILAASVLSAITIALYMTTGQASYLYDSERLTIDFFGIIQDPNYLSIVFFPCIAIATFLVMRVKQIWIKLLAVVLILLVCFSELLMGCRGGLFTCLFVVFLTIVVNYKVSIKFLLSIAIAALILHYMASLLIGYLPDSVAYRFSVEALSSDDAGARFPIWQKTIDIMESNPLLLIFGYGTGSSQALIGGATHNFPLQLILEEGFIGFGIFAAFCLKKLRIFWENKDPIAFAIFAGTLFMSLSLSVISIFQFWMVLAIAILLTDNRFLSSN